MALMEWATGVPQKLLQCDAILFMRLWPFKDKVELISKESYKTDYCLQFGSMKKEFRVIVDQ